MATSSNTGTYFYSPDVKAYIKSAAITDSKGNPRILDLSGDIMNVSVTRQINATSTATLQLSNKDWKYTPGSRDDNYNQPLPIETMDQLVIFMKRQNWLQVFSGYVTNAPIATLVPEPVTVQANCTLYKVQNTFWDVGNPEFQSLMPGLLQSAANTASKWADGGAAQGIVNVLTQVVGWDSNKIHISAIPDSWTSNVKTIYSSVLKSLPQNTTDTLIRALDGAGIIAGQNLIGTGITGKGQGNYVTYSGLSPQLIQAVAIPNGFQTYATLPPGGSKQQVDSEGNQGIVTVTVPVKDVLKYYHVDGKNNPTGDSGQDPDWWCVISWPYFVNNFDSTTVAEAIKWLQTDGYNGASGRHLLLTSVTNARQVVVKASIAGYTDNNIVISRTAWEYLAGDPITTNVAANNISPTGTGNYYSTNSIVVTAAWANTNANGTGTTVKGIQDTTNLQGQLQSYGFASGPTLAEQQLTTTTTTKSATGATSTTNKSSTPASTYTTLTPNKSSTPASTYTTFTPNSGSSGSINPVSTGKYGTTTASGNTSNSIGIAALAWARQLTGVPYKYGGTWPESGGTDCSGLVQWAYSKVGISLPRSTYDQYLDYQLPRNEPLQPGDLLFIAGGDPQGNKPGHVMMYVSPGQVFQALETGTRIGQFAYPTAQYEYATRPALQNPKTPRVPLPPPSKTTTITSQITNNGPSFNATFTAPTIDTETLLFLGSPRAFITDQPVMNAVNNMATGGLRQFQSAPNGDFVAWFPDYFGLYGQAPTLNIADIEIIDFQLYHDDTQLATHIGVSGDQINLGTSVGLIDWIQSNGIISVQVEQVMAQLFGFSSVDALNKAFPDFSNQFLLRYGMRPLTQEQPIIRSHVTEFFYAWQLFMQSWANQYSVQVQFTFMPELYPGMRVRLQDHGIEVYVQSVSHQGDRAGGFTTTAQVTCPVYRAHASDPNPTFLHYGYPRNGNI